MSASITVEVNSSLPSEETVLFQYSGVPTSGTTSITIPTGVSVIRVVGNVTVPSYGPGVARVTNADTGVMWLSAGDASTGTMVGGQSFVQVTPGKTYNIEYFVSVYYNQGGGDITISYSQGINVQTPTVTDL